MKLTETFACLFLCVCVSWNVALRSRDKDRNSDWGEPEGPEAAQKLFGLAGHSLFPSLLCKKDKINNFHLLGISWEIFLQCCSYG